MSSWDDLPEGLWDAFAEITDGGDWQWAITEISAYMLANHACEFGHSGSRVDACERLAQPDSTYCVIHEPWT